MKSAILTTGLTPEEMEKCRLLLLKAMDSSLPQDSPGLSLTALLTMRENHRIQFDEISQAAGWGPLIRRTPAADQAKKQ